MGQVTAFTLYGLDLWFNSSDHEPPHFHARKPDRWEVRINIRELTHTIKWARTKIRQKDLQFLLEGAALHQAELLVEWEKKVDC